MSEKFQVIELSDKSIEKIAKAVHKLDKRDREKARKEFKSQSLHNTKMLLENYHKLKSHTDETEELLNDMAPADLWYNGYLTLDSLMKNRAKTVKMMWHVDDSLGKYEKICHGEIKKFKARKFDILNDLYVNRLSLDIVATRFDVDRTTIIRNRDEAVKDLSIILFGIDFFNEM